MSDFSLADEFPRPDHSDWLGLVEKTLKGADYERSLVSHNYDGLRIDPLFNAYEHPFQDVSQPLTAKRGPPHICQSFSHPDLEISNREIREDLNGGVTAIRLRISDGVSPGIVVKDLADLERVLDGVYLDVIPIELDAGNRSCEFAALLSALWRKRQLDTKAQGAFSIDPISLFAAQGNIENGLETSLRHAAQAAKETSNHFPQITALSADMRSYHLAGASEAQEIAIAAATGVAYLRVQEQLGMSLETAARQISFLLNSDTNVFLNIAKLRGFKVIWSQITAACGIDPHQADIKITTAQRMMSRRDPWVNMLRATAACFAANIAGAKSVTIAPYTDALGLPDAFGRRIARNIQIILQEEAHLAQVIDPAAGSWFVENLTGQMIEKSWAHFQEIEAEGGIISALKTNFLQKKIATVAATRAKNIASRKDALTGVSEFPNLNESPVDFAACSNSPRAAHRENALVWSDTLEKMISETLSGANILPATISRGAVCMALPIHRLDHEFEILRSASDAILAKTGTRPGIFLANIGKPSEFNMRATFAANFFAAGGIEPVTSDGFFEAQEAVQAFEKSGLKIAVLCSSDDGYQRHGIIIAKALKEAGAEQLYLAGNGGALGPDLQKAGIDTFITLGQDVVAILSEVHKILGITNDE